MIFVSVTRLRIRSIRFLPAFVLDALRSSAQVKRADGFLGGALLNDRERSFWTMSGWTSQAAMRAYMTAGAHRRTMPKLMRWCDEASVVHWEQEGMALPDWAEADARMRTEGRPSKVRHPSPVHATLGFRAPRTSRAAPILPRGGR